MSCRHIGERRFPMSALVAAAKVDSVVELARRFGVARRQMHRYVAGGGVPECAVDRLAVACGLHPGEVWAEWFEGAS